jgi:hypothetical protein
MWDAGGFAFWLANYQDMFFSQEANDLCADYIKRKIRKTVKDPVVAEKLIPSGYAYGTKRQPLDTNYYETFNKDNVLLVDAKTDGAIEEITEAGIRAGGKEYPLDIIVFATGFDAMTGPLKALNLKGRGGRTLDHEWRDGPHTWHLCRRLSELVHHHRPAKPFGAVEHAGIDRAACRVDYRLHCNNAQDRKDHHRSDAIGAGAMGCPCQRNRQRDAHDQRQLLVHERQHSGQTACFLALSGAGGSRRLQEEVRRDRGQGLRGIRIGVDKRKSERNGWEGCQSYRPTN